MTNTPLVSIIIPLYNAEKYIAEALQSALNQTWPNKEIIIIDDGSTDNSFAIVGGYQDKNITIIRGENKGASASRNIGLKEARGEYIQFLDADDLLSENKIAAQMELLLGHHNYVGLCATVHFQDGDDPLAAATTNDWYAEGSDNPVDFLIKLYGDALIGPGYGGMIQPNAWLTPMHLIEKAGLWNEELSLDDDGEFFCRIVLAADGIKYTRNGANYYRKFTGRSSLSAQKSYKASKSILQSTLLKTKYLTAKTSDARAKLGLSRLLWDNAYGFYPKYLDLVAIAESKAKELTPAFKFNPYSAGFKFLIVQIFGWKFLKYLQYLKHRN